MPHALHRALPSSESRHMGGSVHLQDKHCGAREIDCRSHAISSRRYSSSLSNRSSWATHAYLALSRRRLAGPRPVRCRAVHSRVLQVLAGLQGADGPSWLVHEECQQALGVTLRLLGRLLHVHRCVGICREVEEADGKLRRHEHRGGTDWWSAWRACPWPTHLEGIDANCIGAWYSNEGGGAAIGYVNGAVCSRLIGEEAALVLLRMVTTS